MLKIKNWNEVFECADSRKRQRLGWFHCPSGPDSAGYINLMQEGDAGMLAFGCFIAICEWSATNPRAIRGKCCRTNGTPLSIKEIASRIRADINTLESSLELLMRDDVQWIEDDPEIQDPPDDLPEVSQSPDDTRQPSPEDVKGKGKGKGQGKGKGEDTPASAGVSYEDESSEPKSEFVFALVGGKTCVLPEKKIVEYESTYPFDVRQELRKARQWLRDNPSRRKASMQGLKSMLTKWMNRKFDFDSQQGETRERTPEEFARDFGHLADED